MSPEEAAKIADVVVLVDGGCSVCVRNATERLMRHLPDVDWKALVKERAVYGDGSPQYWQKEVDGWKAAEPEWDERDEPQSDGR